MQNFAVLEHPAAGPLIVFVLSFLAILGLFWTLFHGQLSGKNALRRRLRQVAGEQVATTGGSSAALEQRTRQSIEKALNEMTAREQAKQRAKMTLKMRLNQADLTWSPMQFYLRVFLVALGALVVLKIIFGAAMVVAGPASVGIGLVGMNFFLKRAVDRRKRAFLEEFPNAIDIVTRGVKTGLPLGDCLNAIAKEGQEPLRTEFRKIVDDIAVGLTVPQALQRLTQRVPLTEANFFSVVVTIQSQLGGNLSEALGNLSNVLRERKMMKQKIKAFSAEAKASGMIIASMPVAVGGILSLTSPDYIGLLFSEFTGNIVLGFCAIWMATGVIVMRNMIRFDF